LYRRFITDAAQVRIQTWVILMPLRQLQCLYLQVPLPSTGGWKTEKAFVQKHFKPQITEKLVLLKTTSEKSVSKTERGARAMGWL